MYIKRKVIAVQSNDDHQTERLALEQSLKEHLGKRKPTKYTQRKFRGLALSKEGLDFAVPIVLGCSELTARRFIASINEPDPVRFVLHGNLYRVKYPQAYDLLVRAMADPEYRRMPAIFTLERFKKHGVPCPSLQTIRRWKSWNRMRNRRCPRRRESRRGAEGHKC